jgi:integrase
MFQSATGGRLDRSNVLRRVIKPAAEEADVAFAGWHTLRHSCASILFSQGRNAVQVQRWLGHHSPAFTLSVYVHLLDGDLGDALDPFEGDNQVTTEEAEAQRNARQLNGAVTAA